MNKLRQTGQWLDNLLPCQCVLCQTDAANALCADCLAQLPWLAHHHCPHCALPTPDGQICGRCITASPAFDACHALFAYQEPMNQLVMAGKYGGRWQLWPLLGRLMAQHRPQGLSDGWLVALPLHASRLAERGFNQAQELGKPLALATGLPLQHGVLERVRDTEHQSRLSSKARHRNLRHAFAAKPDVAGRHIIVIDDVLTSGASLDAAARALKAAGASKVSAWVLARTLKT